MGARDEREAALHWEYISGKPVVFFQNSVISRGLDVDQYNVLMVYDANFAQPFWTIADPAVAQVDNQRRDHKLSAEDLTDEEER